MLDESAQQILERIGDGSVVLDVGGGARPFARADWVLDLLPYDQRGRLGWNGDRSNERFGPETWVQRDICQREAWPFADQQFDFAVCSHTLEDVRDPVWVSGELQRVARAGYIEVPSLREELSYGIQGPWVGWGHHRWLVLVDAQRVEFLFKHHVVNRRGSHLPNRAVSGLPESERVQTLWWEGGFEATERFLWTAAELDGFLESTVRRYAGGRPSATTAGRLRRLLPNRASNRRRRGA
jgi:Methyltransferase domain